MHCCDIVDSQIRKYAPDDLKFVIEDITEGDPHKVGMCMLAGAVRTWQHNIYAEVTNPCSQCHSFPYQHHLADHDLQLLSPALQHMCIYTMLRGGEGLWPEALR